MLKIYNDSIYPDIWEIYEINPKLTRINLKGRKHFGINFSSPNEGDVKKAISVDALNTTGNEKNFQNVVSEKMALRFYEKSCDPFIRLDKNLKFDFDVYLITLQIGGSQLINNISNKGFVIDYFVDDEKGLFHIIATLGREDARPSLEFIFKDDDADLLRAWRLIYDRKTERRPGKSVISPIILYRTKNVNDKENKPGTRGYIKPDDFRSNGVYKIRKYTPIRCTKLVVVDDRIHKGTVEKLAEERHHYRPGNVVVVDSGDQVSYNKTLQKMRDDKYTAITFYVNDYNGEQLKKDRNQLQQKALESFGGKDFKVVYLMANDGYVFRIK